MKVKCTGYKDDERCFTIGKCYEWNENELRNDSGYCYTSLVEGEDPKKWYLSRWYNFEVVNDFNKIVITTDGSTTTAKMYEGKEVVKTAAAKCAPDDEFNFEIGAKIAFERLTCSTEKTEPTKKIVPHLKSVEFSENFGVIGEKTNYVDKLGNKLFVGDTVKVICKHFRISNCVVCQDEGGAFVMGIQEDCNPSTGEICLFEIEKERSFEEIKDGEIIDDGFHKIKYIKSDKGE